MTGKRRTKRIEHIFFDVETYHISGNEPLDHPEIKEVLIHPDKTTIKRNFVNNEVYGIGWIHASYKFNRKRLTKLENGTFKEWEKGEDGEIFVKFGNNCVNEFLDYLANINSYDIYLYAYNVSYDYHAILQHILKKLNVTNIRTTLDKKKNLVSCKVFFKSLGRSHVLTFWDLWQWNKTVGLNEWMKLLFNKHKEELDYSKEDIEFNTLNNLPYRYINRNTGEKKDFNYDLELKYLTEDVKALPILKKYIEYWKRQAINSILPEGIIKQGQKDYYFTFNKPTRSGFAKSLNTLLIRHNSKNKIKYFDSLYRIPCCRNVYSMQKASRLGGFTAGTNNSNLMSWEGKEGEFAVLIDVNSMYPYIMNNGLPFGDLLFDKPVGEKFITWYLIEGNTPPTWKPKYDVFDNSFIGKCVFNMGYFKNIPSECRWYINKELFDLMEEMCLKSFEVVGEFYQKVGNHMSPFLLKCFKLKTKFNDPKTLEESVARESSKVCLNSQYGKILESSYEDTLVWNHDLKQYVRMNDEDIEQGLKECLPGIFITSKSRVILLKTIKKLIDNGCKFLYCDTDSVAFIPNGEKSWAFIELDKEALGAWSIERICNRFLYSGKRKKYYFDNTKTKEEVAKYFPNLEITDKLIKPKKALSGFSLQLFDNLTWKEIKTLMDPNKNIIIKRGKKVRRIDNLTMKSDIYETDSEFNPGKEIIGEMNLINGKWILKLYG